MTSDLGSRTIKDFGEQWTTFRENPGYYGSSDLLADIFGPLLPLAEIKGLRVAEIGSGTGRIVNMLLEAGADHIHAVEPSAAMDVLRANTADRRDRITYIQGTGDTLPRDLGLDLVCSVGVIHHIPDPGPVIRAAFEALKPAGRCVIWLYGREGNETYLRIVEPLRRLTTRLPHAMLRGLVSVMAVGLDIYIALCRMMPLPMRGYMREVLAKMPRHARRLIVYDQLNPAYSKYYPRHEAEAVLRQAGFADVQLYHRHGYSWTVIGTRPA